MHLLKIIFLLVLVLAISRLASWTLGRLLRLIPRCSFRAAAILSNSLCFIAFTTWLFFDLEHGEPVDPKAIAFGAAIYLAYALLDLYLLRRQTPKQQSRTVESA